VVGNEGSEREARYACAGSQRKSFVGGYPLLASRPSSKHLGVRRCSLGDWQLCFTDWRKPVSKSLVCMTALSDESGDSRDKTFPYCTRA
jgi:hypothetical protein